MFLAVQESNAPFINIIMLFLLNISEEMKLPRDDAFKKKLARVYVEEKSWIDRSGPNDFTEKELEQFYDQALMLEIVS